MAEVLPSEELIEEPSDFGALQPGMRLGRYELLVPIARGGMARVWAARLHGQRGFQKLVAIKVILPHLAEEPEFERMFLDEARIASGVHHPNVCEIYELGEEKKTLYLVMEWVSGDSFSRVIRATGRPEALDARVVARIVADACAGVHAAHELADDDGRAMGVVHRDLSPHNILITADGTAKVCDFGVAKALGQLHEATSAGQLKGKIAYMAPEQITGSEVDRRSDVFSLGCVLYEATTGVRPFRGDGDHQVMHAVLKGEITPPSSYVRGYPSELERIVLRALAPKPLHRFPTAERMRFALEELLARGTLVTQANVAQLVRARIGPHIDKRRERIRQASTVGDRDGGFRDLGGMTPSNQVQGGHRSGVQAAGGGLPAAQGKPLFSTMQMNGPEAAAALAQLASAAPPGSAPPVPSNRPPPVPSNRPPPAPTPPLPYPAAAPAYGQPQHAHLSYPGAAHPHPAGPSGPPPHHGYSYPGAAYPDPSHSASYPGALYTPSGSYSGSYAGPPPQDPARSAPPPHVTMPPTSAPFGAPGPYPLQPTYPPQRAFAPHPGDGSEPAQAGAGQYMLAIVAGVLVAALIGVGGFVVWRRSHPPVTVDPVTVGSAAAASGASGASGPSGAGAASAGTGDDGTVKAPSAEIGLQVAPPEATITVDGHELGPQIRTVPRPPMGKTVTVVVKAPGFADATLSVDSFTASPTSVLLEPAAAAPHAEPPAAVEPPAAPAAAAADPTKDPPTKPKPKKDPKPDPAVPANPY